MLMKGGRPLSELTAEEIDQLINQKSAEMDNMKQNQRRDSAELNSTNRLRENLRGSNISTQNWKMTNPSLFQTFQTFRNLQVGDYKVDLKLAVSSIQRKSLTR